MLPGGLHYFLAPSRTSAKSIAKGRGLKAGEYIGLLETIAPSRNFHGLIDIYLADYDETKNKQQAEHELIWLPITDVAAMDFERSGSASYIASKYLSGELLPRMTYIVNK